MGCSKTDISTPAIGATARREGHSGGVLLEHDTGGLDTADCNNPPFHGRPGGEAFLAFNYKPQFSFCMLDSTDFLRASPRGASSLWSAFGTSEYRGGKSADVPETSDSGSTPPGCLTDCAAISGAGPSIQVLDGGLIVPLSVLLVAFDLMSIPSSERY